MRRLKELFSCGLRAASAPWNEGMEVNPLYYWNMQMPWNSGTRIKIPHLQQRKRKKKILRAYLSNSSEKYLCEPLGWECRFLCVWLLLSHLERKCCPKESYPKRNVSPLPFEWPTVGTPLGEENTDENFCYRSHRLIMIIPLLWICGVSPFG